MDNLREFNEWEGVAHMKLSYTQIFPPVINKLYKTNPRVEQGFYDLPTGKPSSYYDYLYMHTSS